MLRRSRMPTLARIVGSRPRRGHGSVRSSCGSWGSTSEDPVRAARMSPVASGDGPRWRPCGTPAPRNPRWHVGRSGAGARTDRRARTSAAGGRGERSSRSSPERCAGGRGLARASGWLRVRHHETTGVPSRAAEVERGGPSARRSRRGRLRKVKLVDLRLDVDAGRSPRACAWPCRSRCRSGRCCRRSRHRVVLHLRRARRVMMSLLPVAVMYDVAISSASSTVMTSKALHGTPGARRWGRSR